jgi:hypothetical protein
LFTEEKRKKIDNKAFGNVKAVGIKEKQKDDVHMAGTLLFYFLIVALHLKQ